MLTAIRGPESRRTRPHDEDVIPLAIARVAAIPAGRLGSNLAILIKRCVSRPEFGLQIHVDDVIDDGAASIEAKLYQRRTGYLPRQVHPALVRFSRFVPYGQDSRAGRIETTVKK